jgi:hypothetical protein
MDSSMNEDGEGDSFNPLQFGWVKKPRAAMGFISSAAGFPTS